MQVTPGARLGRYEIRSLLGAGGMGEVYLAYDHDLERDVAIKVLRDGASESSDRVRRFIQEAKAASGLHHPNVAHVYEIGTHDDVRFIAMEIVEGETLRDRVARGPLSIDDAIAIGLQIAGALAAAHKAGIVHRDIKPENVIVSADGFAKVLDFGLAKLREIRNDDAATLLKTTPGLTMGTLGYMAPEQLSGGDVTPAADVFSLGVVLYEMISGRRPFEGTTTTEVVASIVSKAPRPLHELRADTPPKLEAVISKALAKNANDRFPSAGEMLEQLRQISREAMSAAAIAPRPNLSKRVMVPAITVLVVALAVVGVWFAARAKRQRGAEESIKSAERLLAERKLPEAYETAAAAAAILPSNDRVRDVIARTSTPMTVESDPRGATVFVQRFNGPAERTRAGTTPVTIEHVPLADYVVTLEKPGYASTTLPVSLTPFYIRGGVPLPQAPPRLRLKLMEASKVPAGMVFVEGGEYQLAGWSRPSDRAVNLRDFFIDRYEVSNRDFEEFVRAGAYRRPELWKLAFADEGKTLSFEQAMARLHDTTGLPGPRNWSGGAPPAGRENHPVTDVTWYEADAFAEWKGKKLPTVYEWEKTARYKTKVTIGMTLPWGVVGAGVDATERANFLGKGTMPVDSLPFGISPWGAYNMAGNVAEWCRNPKAPGFAFRGGGWNDAVYAFGQTGGYPAFFSSGKLGFRCVKEIQPDADQGAFVLTASGFVPAYQPVDDRAFAEIRKQYEYPKTPLNAHVIETVEARDWKREKIAYDVGGSTVTAYLYLPIGYHPPLQVIHFAPAADVDGGFRTLPASIESQFPPFIRGGRAVFSVLLEGYVGRSRAPDFEAPDSRSAERVEYIAKRVTELRRGLDYLESRNDLDHSRVAFIANSAGTYTGVILTALEKRYRSVLFTGTGIEPHSLSDIAAANRINFAPRISAPKLMLHGRYDEDTPLKSEAEPLFRLLREPKHLQLYDGGHTPPMNLWIPTVTRWLDETLGPVRQ
jgi:formylglycine-generating enzyme required for sulfatase activity/pimeloyl-ACP methyl ester carboxylesterase